MITMYATAAPATWRGTEQRARQDDGEQDRHDEQAPDVAGPRPCVGAADDARVVGVVALPLGEHPQAYGGEVIPQHPQRYRWYAARPVRALWSTDGMPYTAIAFMHALG